MGESLKFNKTDKIIATGFMALAALGIAKEHVPDAVNPEVIISNIVDGSEAHKFTDPKLNEQYDKATTLPEGVFEYVVTPEDKSATDIAEKIAASPEDMSLIRDEVSGQIGDINAGENVYLPTEQVK